MIQELLVLMACTQSAGCSQTTSAYYTSNPETYSQVKKHTSRLKAFVGPEVVASTPILVFPITHKATFKITNHISLQTSHDKTLLFINFSF